MKRGAKSLVAVWRDALRDSDVAATPKLVGFVISTYMNGRGFARPGRAAIARGATVDVRSVDRGTRTLEAVGFLEVDWSDGGRSRTNLYQATLPETATQVRRSEWETANVSPQTATLGRLNGDTGSPESVESAESGALGAAPAFGGGAAGALVEDDCMLCLERQTLYPWKGRLVCLRCVHAETQPLEDDLRAHVAALREAAA